MYTQRISADLSSSIYSGDWNMQIRQLLMLELQNTFACSKPQRAAFTQHWGRGGRKKETCPQPKEGSDGPFLQYQKPT